MSALTQLRSPLLDPPDFTIDFYLSSTLKAIEYCGTSHGITRLRIERHNYDLRRVLSEAIGMAAGVCALLQHAGLDVTTLSQLSPNDMIRARGGPLRRPDLLGCARGSWILLECKGTTSSLSTEGMIERGRLQVKDADVEGHKVGLRLVSCAFVPLMDDSAIPAFRIEDPEKRRDEAGPVYHRSTIDGATWRHYIRVSNAVGLPLLARELAVRAGMEVEAVARSLLMDELSSAVEHHTVEIGGGRYIGRIFEQLTTLPREEKRYGCQRYIVRFGMHPVVARALLEGDQEGIHELGTKLKEDIHSPTLCVLKDGFALSIEESSERAS